MRHPTAVHDVRMGERLGLKRIYIREIIVIKIESPRRLRGTRGGGKATASVEGCDNCSNLLRSRTPSTRWKCIITIGSARIFITHAHHQAQDHLPEV